jgi:hypothetical protein
MILIAIDPGAHTGLAFFRHTVLIGAYAIKDGEPLELRPDDQLIIECPEYQKGRRVSPNDLITLALRVGRIQGRAQTLGAKCELVRPSEWKGNVPKRIHHERILARLTGVERVLTEGVSGDALDAIGIGLWKLGRL